MCNITFPSSCHKRRTWRTVRHNLQIRLDCNCSRLSPLAPRNVLSKSVTANLLPVDLLPGDRQLPSQRLERALVHPGEGTVQLLLVVALRGRDAGDDRLGGEGGDGDVDGLVRAERDVAVLVVVDVDVDVARYRRGLRHRELVDGTEAAVPVSPQTGQPCDYDGNEALTVVIVRLTRSCSASTGSQPAG